MNRLWIAAFISGVLVPSSLPIAGTAAPLPDRVRASVGAQDRSVGVLLDHTSFGHEGRDGFETRPEGNTNWTWGFRLFTEPYERQLGWDARGLRSRTEFDATIQTFNLLSNSFAIGGHFIAFTFGRQGINSPHAGHVYLAEVEYFSDYLDGGSTNFIVDVRRLAAGDDTPYTGSLLLPAVFVYPGTNTVGRIRVFFAPGRAITSRQIVRTENALTVNFIGQRGGRYSVALFRRRNDGSLRLFQKRTVFAPLPQFGEPLDSTGPVSVTFTGRIPLNGEVVRIVAQ